MLAMHFETNLAYMRAFRGGYYPQNATMRRSASHRRA